MDESADRTQHDASTEDARVIARVLDGDRQQFALLVARHQEALYRYAVALVLDHDVAADMVQDAFIRVYTNLRTCRDHARFKAWLFKTLRNRCFDHLKAAHRRNAPLEDAGPIADPAERPDARVERVRLRERIAQALAMLPDVQREAFLMHHVEGVPYHEMAGLLDASVSALKMRVLRAREAMTGILRNSGVTQVSSGSSFRQGWVIRAEEFRRE